MSPWFQKLGLKSQRSSPRRFLLGALLCSLLASPLAGEPRLEPELPESVRLEAAFLTVLAAWTEGSETAPSDWVDLENQVLERAVGPLDGRDRDRGIFQEPKFRRAKRCLEAVQRDVFETLAPDTYAADSALSLFFVRAYIDAKSAPPRKWLADASWDRFRESAARERRALASDPVGDPAKARRARSVRSSSYAAVLLFRLPLIESLDRARKVFAEVVERSPEDRFALYWLGFLDQQRGSAEAAVRSFDRLLRLDPADAEAQLRRGTLHQALGMDDLAQRDFAAAARSATAPSAVRRLAYQELARSLRARSLRTRSTADERFGEVFAEVLAEGLTAFPDDRGLLHLAVERALTRRDDDSVPDDRVFEWVAALSKPRVGITPRFRYEAPRPQGLDGLRSEVERDLEAVFETLRPHLRSALEAFPERAGAQKPKRACVGLGPTGKPIPR